MIFFIPFLLTSIALIYNHTLFIQKLQTVREEVSIPTSEQNAYVDRIRFLSTAIQNSHYKILTYNISNQRELLEAEVMAMEDLTALRLTELQRLKTSVEKNRPAGNPCRLLLHQLEMRIAALDAKHHDFLKGMKSESKNWTTQQSINFSQDWNDLHNKVLETISAFLTHNKKEVEESQELVFIAKQNSLNLMYLILGVSVWFLFISIVVADYTVIKSMEKICRQK